MALSWPVDAPVTQQFGTNPNSIQPNGHTGIDFGVAEGTPLHAADSGNIVFEGWASNLSSNNPWWIAPAYAGICVLIDHNDGLISLYGHMSSTVVDNGQFVEKGQLIGYSGSTGLSTGPHLHFEILGWPLQPYNGYYGRVNPNHHVGGIAQAPEIAGNQRIVGSYGVKERTGPSTQTAEGRTFGSGDALTFKGFVRGESAYGTDVWFVGAFSGTFFHASAFDDADTHDLQDLTPPPAPVSVGTTQRKVGGAVIRYRKAPNTSAEIVHEYQPGDILNFSQWTRGQDVGGNNVWFKGAISGGYAWSGGFEDQSTNGLSEEASTTPAPAPAPVPAPTDPINIPTPPYTFVKDFDFVEYKPAHFTNVQAAYDNPGITVFPPKPEKTVIHQFDARAKNPSLDGVINHFATERPGSESSAHFSVSGQRIVQHVSLKDRAYHAGKVGNSYIGIETDPDQDAETIASVKKLLKALKEKYGYEFPLTLHKDVPGNSTNCGIEISLADYKLEAAPVVPVPDPVPTPTPAPEPTPVPEPQPIPTPSVSEEAVIDSFLASLKKSYFNSK